jgi:hypothetical protein
MLSRPLKPSWSRARVAARELNNRRVTPTCLPVLEVAETEPGRRRPVALCPTPFPERAGADDLKHSPVPTASTARPVSDGEGVS